MSASSPERVEFAVPRNITWEWHSDFETRDLLLVLKDRESRAQYVKRFSYRLTTDTVMFGRAIDDAVQTFLAAVLGDQDVRPRDEETYH